MLAARLKRIAGTCIREADFSLQSYFCLTQELLAEEPDPNARAGAFTADDWSRSRRIRAAQSAPGEDRLASNETYLRYLSSIHDGKMLSVQSVIESFDFGRYGRIIELGCGDMPQAFAISSRFPGVSYTATDADPYVIERCAQLPLLREIRKFVLDVTHADLEELRNHDLVTSWSLEFSLQDLQLNRLFAACRKHSVPYLLCTHAAIGPIDYLCRELLLKKRQRRVVPGKGFRVFGWLRSTGEIARLAREAGMVLQRASYHVNHAALFFAPSSP